MIKFGENEKAGMEKTLEEARSVLFAEDVGARIKEGGEDESGQGANLMDSMEILGKEAADQINLASKEFDEFINDEKQGVEEKKYFFETLGWTKSEFRAMIGVLSHSLPLINVDFNPPDENEKNHRSGDARNLKNLILDSISHDYSPEVADKVAPLVDLYFMKARENLIKFKDEKSRTEKGEAPPEGEEMI